MSKLLAMLWLTFFNTEILKVAIAQLCNDLQVRNFSMSYLIQKQVNNIFKQNSLNAIVFMLQVILLNMKVPITHLAIGRDSQFTHHVVAIEKVAE